MHDELQRDLANSQERLDEANQSNRQLVEQLNSVLDGESEGRRDRLLTVVQQQLAAAEERYRALRQQSMQQKRA